MSAGASHDGADDGPVGGLDGIRVLDLADHSAALTGRILADLGAEVILVEPPGGGPLRSLRPHLDGVRPAERSCVHQYFSANKASIELDIEDPAARDTFLRLVASADVVVETSPPGRLDGLGLGHERLREVRADLIQVSVTPFGLTSPWRDRRATDVVAGAAGGLIHVSGEPRGTPVQGGANPSYCMASLAAASAVTIALTQRDATGAGAHVDVSLQEATVTAVTQTATPTAWTWFGRIPGRPGLSSALECADGGHVGHLVRPDNFGSFLAWLDRVGVEHAMTLDDAHHAVVGSPSKGNPVVAATFALASRLTRDEFAAGALEADIVCLPVLGFADMAGNEQYLVNRQFATVPHPDIDRELGFVRSPVDTGAARTEIRPAPVLGADTRRILAALPPAVDPTPAPTPRPSPETALAGIRVVDFGWVLAAPLGGRILASFGAEVIRVESSRRPDSMRRQRGPDGEVDPDLGGLFNSVNAGKQSLTVDLGTDDGLALVKELIATSDVVVNNFRPGALVRMGLGYEVLRALREDIVLLNLPGAHPVGPWAARPSMGNILMAASGFNMLTGFPGEKPRGIGIAYPDFTSPHLLVATILAALRRRRREGRGAELTLTQLSGIVSLLGVEWMHFVDSAVEPRRRANRDPNHCPHGVYAAAGDDQWVAVSVATDQQWEALCAVMGISHLAELTFGERRLAQDDLDHHIDAWTCERDKWDIADALQAAGVPAAAVADLADTYERDPQLRHHYQTVHQPTAPDVDIPVDAEPARWVGADHRLRRAPRLGEHTRSVVTGILGRSDEEYADLVARGVLS